MAEEYQVVSLASLCKGAAIERFDDELKKVLENMMDVNTGVGPREIVLKVRLKPNDDRTSAAGG